MKIMRTLSLLVIIIFVLSSTQINGDDVDGLYYYEDFEFSFDTATDLDGYYSQEGFTVRGYISETDRIMTHPNAAHQGQLGLSIKSHFLESRTFTFTVSTVMNMTIEHDTIISLWVNEVKGETSMRVTISNGLSDFISYCIYLYRWSNRRAFDRFCPRCLL